MIAQKLAAKMLLIACLGLISACGLVFLPKAKATTILGNADPMSRSCATNFVRTLPNYCSYSGGSPGSTTLTSDNTCRSIDLVAAYGIPSSSTVVAISMNHVIRSAAAVAHRIITTDFYINNTCATHNNTRAFILQQREWVALAAANIAQDIQYAHAANIGTNGILYYRSALTACVGCNAFVSVYGYYD